ATYHVTYNPPKEEGLCDRDSSKLIQRDDDRQETVENRLAVNSFPPWNFIKLSLHFLIRILILLLDLRCHLLKFYPLLFLLVKRHLLFQFLVPHLLHLNLNPLILTLLMVYFLLA